MQMQKLLTFFQQKYERVCIFNDQGFNDTLTNNIVSFEQLGLVVFQTHHQVAKWTCSNIRTSMVRS